MTVNDHSTHAAKHLLVPVPQPVCKAAAKCQCAKPTELQLHVCMSCYKLQTYLRSLSWSISLSSTHTSTSLFYLSMPGWHVSCVCHAYLPARLLPGRLLQPYCQGRRAFAACVSIPVDPGSYGVDARYGIAGPRYMNTTA